MTYLQTPHGYLWDAKGIDRLGWYRCISYERPRLIPLPVFFRPLLADDAIRTGCGVITRPRRPWLLDGALARNIIESDELFVCIRVEYEMIELERPGILLLRRQGTRMWTQNDMDS